MVTVVVKLRHLLLGKKALTNLDSVLKSKDISFLTKVRLVKATVFPVERLLCAGRASPSPAQLLAFAPGKEQAAGVWEP